MGRKKKAQPPEEKPRKEYNPAYGGDYGYTPPSDWLAVKPIKKLTPEEKEAALAKIAGVKPPAKHFIP